MPIKVYPLVTRTHKSLYVHIWQINGLWYVDDNKGAGSPKKIEVKGQGQIYLSRPYSSQRELFFHYFDGSCSHLEQ